MIRSTFRESARRFRGHLKASTPIYDHQSRKDYSTLAVNFNIVDSEGQSFARTIKESIYIRVKNSTLTVTLVNISCHTHGIEFCVPPRTQSRTSKSKKNPKCTTPN